MIVKGGRSFLIVSLPGSLHVIGDKEEICTAAAANDAAQGLWNGCDSHGTENGLEDISQSRVPKGIPMLHCIIRF